MQSDYSVVFARTSGKMQTSLSILFPHTVRETNKLKAEIWESLKILEPSLKIQPSSKNWRISPLHYKKRTADMLKPGTVSMSPAWFEQGHDVSLIKMLNTKSTNFNRQKNSCSVSRLH